LDGETRVPINRENWSASSRRSLGNYDANAAEYEGIRCKCCACGQSFVCSAEAQRDAYERQKKHINWLPSRCESCASKLAELRERDTAFQTRWLHDKTAASQDVAFVSEWLEVIRAMRPLKFENSMGIHLERLLAAHQRAVFRD